jgi:hypothetical protein
MESTMVHLLDSEGKDPFEPASVHIDRRVTDADCITDELEAISAIGQVLASLPDSDARARVLRWAAERFDINASITAAPAAAAAATTSAIDPTLSVDGLQDLFPAAPVKDTRAHLPVDDTLALHDVLPGHVPAAMPAAAPITTMATDNSQLALEIESLELDAPAIEQPAAAAGDPQRAESLIHSFVADLQRLAQDCQTVFAPVSTTPQ